MANAQRVKGRRAEAEVAAILRAAGFTIRGLESGGDHLAVRGALHLHIEVKRQERGFRAAWARQAARDAPFGSLPVVVFRASRAPWWVATPEFRAAPWLLNAGWTAGLHYTLRDVDGEEWAYLDLASFLAAVA